MANLNNICKLENETCMWHVTHIIGLNKRTTNNKQSKGCFQEMAKM